MYIYIYIYALLPGLSTLTKELKAVHWRNSKLFS